MSRRKAPDEPVPGKEQETTATPVTGVNVPATARYHREAVEQIVQCVEEGVYCALLGPRLSGKTILLRYLAGDLGKLLGWTCAYLDLLEMRATTQQAFFAGLMRLTAERFAEQTGRVFPIPEEKHASSAAFRAFLTDCLEAAGHDLVLIIDPLEALPTDLVQALLTSLRAAYMEQQNLTQRLTVVVSGALSLATLAVGESSPFRGIARRVFIGDLSESDSRALISDLLVEYGINATRPALDRLLQATRGDVFLIHRISQRCAELLSARRNGYLRAGDVERIARRFLRQEVYQYAPLVEAIRLIEDDPDLLHCILRLLEEELVPRAGLPLPLSPDLDPLYLTGVVENCPGDMYRLQNNIYREFLSTHFNPGRVGRVLAMAGRWDSAIDYLEASLSQGDHTSHADLLPATINSIYAAENLGQAVRFLRRGLAALFRVTESRIWLHTSQVAPRQARPASGPMDAQVEGHLRLVGPAQYSLQPPGPDQSDLAAEPDAYIPVSADRLEARAYRYKVPLRGQEEEGRVVRAIPLILPGGRPIGVATVYEELSGESFSEQRERDLHMAGFLNQAARALYTVSMRRQELALAGRVQASLLPLAPPAVPGWQITTAWRPARETSGDFYDFVPLAGGRLGLVMADVVDKGLGAALLMALTRTLVRTYAPSYPRNPELLLEVTNRRILEDINTGQFVTFFYGVLDPNTGELIYANAGHPPPYLFNPGQEPQEIPGSGRPLGIAEDSSWQAGSVSIEPDSLLLLYTDGLYDARNPDGEFFGTDRLQAVVQEQMGKPARSVQEALMASIFTFAGAEPQVDDMALMVIIREEKPPEARPRIIGGGRSSFQRRIGTGTVD